MCTLGAVEKVVKHRHKDLSLIFGTYGKSQAWWHMLVTVLGIQKQAAF